MTGWKIAIRMYLGDPAETDSYDMAWLAVAEAGAKVPVAISKGLGYERLVG